MLLHAVVGKDERESNSPSWFNITGKPPGVVDSPTSGIIEAFPQA
jgi:hypothetical protein